jgi:tetratricopeptide (TPR) repeat protein
MYFNRFSLVADHWHYPAIIATIALALGGATHLWCRWGRKGQLVGIVVAAVMVAMLGTLSFRRAIVFGSNYSLFAHNAESFPLSSGAQYNYGVALAEMGNLVDAKNAYRQAIALNPKYAEAYYNVAELERVAGELSSALYYYEQAADLSTVAMLAHYGQGQVFEALERRDEARAQYRKVLEVDSSHEGAREALDRLSNDGGDGEKASYPN